MTTRKNFIPLNEGFVCEKCHKTVPSAPGTFRNHCPFCLTAKHVDNQVPGDRASTCQGLMNAISYKGSDPDKLIITHKCNRCSKVIPNKAASDDDKNKIFDLNKP